mmetsp:Transcript_32182/g.31505  ORF Transcript_32182/g.31505 Transcript_32182/m.31505 type:complete len:93 (+) Transcript_32182:214-492(+)
MNEAVHQTMLEYSNLLYQCYMILGNVSCESSFPARKEVMKFDMLIMTDYFLQSPLFTKTHTTMNVIVWFLANASENFTKQNLDTLDQCYLIR